MKKFIGMLLVCLDMIGLLTALVVVITIMTGGSVDLVPDLALGTLFFLAFVGLDLIVAIVNQLRLKLGKR